MLQLGSRDDKRADAACVFPILLLMVCKRLVVPLTSFFTLIIIIIIKFMHNQTKGIQIN